MKDNREDSFRTRGHKEPLPPQTILGYIQPSGSSGYDLLTVMVERKPTRAQLLEIAKVLHKTHRVQKIEFIDNQAFMSTNPTLGQWTSTDDSQVKDKDWSKQPSEQEIVLWEDFLQSDVDISGIDEDKVIKDIAKKHHLSKKETQAAIDKVRDWIAN